MSRFFSKLKSIFSNKIFLIPFMIFLIWILVLLLFFSYNILKEKKQKDFLVSLSKIIFSYNYDKDSCEFILSTNESDLDKNEFISKELKNLYFDYKSKCVDKFDIKNIDVSIDNCEDIIKKDKNFFFDKYIYLDDFENKRNECIYKFLDPKFSTWSFFNAENDFKSTIVVDFWLDFYSDLWDVNSEEFFDNRVEAKNRFLSFIDISPKLDYDINDLVLYPNKAILSLPLNPLTNYDIKFKNYSLSNWLESLEKSFSFSTPDNIYFWLSIEDKSSLFRDNNLPRFKLIEYNSNKTSSNVKICKISLENYSKIEVFRGRDLSDEIKDFFVNSIDEIKKDKCFTKEIFLDKSSSDSKSISSKIKEFDFDEFLWNPWEKWFYVVYFDNYIDREFNWKIVYPVLFSIINSHITMKLSKEWEWFFFVNDFNWNPLEWQDITVYLNDFKDHDTNWDRNIWTYWGYVYDYNSPIDNNIYSTWITLWKTWKDWILKINLEYKIKNSFDRTFWDEFDFEYDWTYRTFLAVSSWNWSLWLVNSSWNSWISPWNFWYTVWNYWWYTDASYIYLDRWSQVENFFSYLYTDRVLYLPWEEVNIKSIIRRSSDLGIPESWEKFNLKIINSKWEEVLNKNYSVNNFWSFSDKLYLPLDFDLGVYNMFLYDRNSKQIWYSSFSLEVFKNPKFKVDVWLKSFWLEAWAVKIENETEIKNNYWSQKNYEWSFSVKSNVSAKYYNWSSLSNWTYNYKVYKQYYYDDSFWWDCYYGCYWEPNKEFYTSWEWKLDENWQASFDVNIDFKSSYDDYKYIVEVTVKDDTWDEISWSNSIIARLPEEYKRWYSDSSLEFSSDKRFYEKWDLIKITWWINTGKRTRYYDDKYLFIIKKKDYYTDYIDDIKWYKRPVSRVKETLEKIMYINSENFKVSNDWKLSLDFRVPKTWEYIFEYAKIWDLWDYIKTRRDLDDMISIFNETKSTKINKSFPKIDFVLTFDEDCIKKEAWEEVLKSETIDSLKEKEPYKILCSKYQEITTNQNLDIYLDDLIQNKKYFSILSYWDESANNPVVDDNKIYVLSEKVSYNLWDKARILVRLPFENWKILLTKEKYWVIESEYINVKSNIFFKEFDIDDSFMPNTYIWVMAVDTNNNSIPEYKLGYSEIVVDKTDKKADITLKTDKEVYKPRDKVELEINIKDKNWVWKKSEVSVMVVDDSLISLMWNIDLNVLEKFYKKLPFQIQTSITNIAMLKNYYFSRPWIVWWSWLDNLKWGDSAVSTRNIFKNTAYYNPSVITDDFWNAKISFDLPDNLTNFRIIAVSNSLYNIFWVWEKNIEVRKNVVLEDRTPIILRSWDKLKLWANLFNNTSKEIEFSVSFDSSDIVVKNKERKIVVSPSSSTFIEWDVENLYNVEKISYLISALWDTNENSDKIKNTIDISDSPLLINNLFKNINLWSWENISSSIKIPENTDLNRSKVEIFVSNNLLSWVEKIVNSLLVYPYWCIEQTTSSTYPNSILLKFSSIFSWIIDPKEALKNLDAWINRIKSMQNDDGWFSYWQWDANSNLHISPYVLRTLIDIKSNWWKVPDLMIEKANKYLEKNYKDTLDPDEKAEIIWALAMKFRSENSWDFIWEKLSKIWIENLTDDFEWKNLNMHSLLAYTYALVLSSKDKYTPTIEKNISRLKAIINTKNDDYWYYWDNLSDKAILASMLMDYDYDRFYIDYLIKDLYSNDWSSYYYSTQSKNNSFMAFAKYIEKYSSFNQNTWEFILSWKTQKFSIWWNNNNIFKKIYELSDVLEWDSINLDVSNFSWWNLYVDFTLSAYPKDKTKIKPYENKISVKREIFKVLDEDKLSDCSSNYYYSENKTDCELVFKKQNSNLFEKDSLYKIKLSIDLEDKNSRDVVIEDFLAAGFRPINSRFNTESSSVRQATSDSWQWSHIEFRPDRVLAHSSYIWWNTAVFEYFVRADFQWTFIYPPATSYLMYNPAIRANWEFSLIEIK